MALMSRFQALLLFCALPVAAGCSALRHSDSPAQVIRGPVAARQQHPISLSLFAFRPRRAVTQPRGELGLAGQLSWSSIEEVAKNPSWAPGQEVGIDGETTRAVLRARYGLAERTDVEVELPLLYATGGGMDSIIEAWHQFFALPNGAREENDDGRYEMRVADGPDVLYELEGDRIGLQDIPVILTHNLRLEDEAGPAVAVRVAVELPTGSEDQGFGNGALDYGVGGLLERTWGRWTLTSALELLLPGDSDRLRAAAGHSFNDMWAVELGGEYRWNDSLSLVAGAVWTTSFLDSIELDELDKDIVDLGLGVAWDSSEESRMTVSIHEDVVALTGSDFTIQLGWLWGY